MAKDIIFVQYGFKMCFCNCTVITFYHLWWAFIKKPTSAGTSESWWRKIDVVPGENSREKGLMVIYHPDGCNGAATFIYCHIYTLYAWQYFTNSKIFLGTINPLMKYSVFKWLQSVWGHRCNWWIEENNWWGSASCFQMLRYNICQEFLDPITSWQ